jgi:hypothetical protein
VILEKKEAVIKYSPTEISPPIIAEKIDEMPSILQILFSIFRTHDMHVIPLMFISVLCSDLSLINYIFHSSSIVPKKAQKPIRFCIINIDGNNVEEENSSTNNTMAKRKRTKGHTII